MLRGLLLVLAGLAAGFAIAWWRAPIATPANTSLPSTGYSSAVVPRSVGNDVAALAAALETERTERAVLAARVDELAANLQALGAAAERPGAASAEPSTSAESASLPRLRRGPVPAENSQRGQVELLLAAGFAPDRAAWIAQRTAELRMAQLQAQYDSAREGKPFDATAMLAGERTLRSDLGDADYERYLQALDRPTSVPVRDVLASSPAQRAGLQPGDEVVAYDGKRVFDFRDLNALTLEGNAGESVVVQVRRNDQVLDLVMPRGPIGIFGGGFRGR
jgi:hypothetical protein